MARGSAFQRAFESKEVLDELLELAGAELATEDVVEVFKEAARNGEQSSEIVPTLFDGEPRFKDPELARQLYQNLLGLWDLVARGGRLELDGKQKRPPREKRERAPRPEPFGNSGPDEAFVEKAWQWLGDLDKRERDRLLHAFENRQDALLAFLDEQALSDEAYACARYLLFELFSMIEVGHPPGTQQSSEGVLRGQAPAEKAPSSLRAYAEEAVFEAEQDEQTPLSPADAGQVRAVVERGLSALWSARK
jgi:hypothetical protein